MANDLINMHTRVAKTRKNARVNPVERLRWRLRSGSKDMWSDLPNDILGGFDQRRPLSE